MKTRYLIILYLLGIIAFTSCASAPPIREPDCDEACQEHKIPDIEDINTEVISCP